MIFGLTGHRDYRGPLLDDFAMRVVAQRRPTGVISGMALGWDQAIVKACLRHGIGFVAAIPFEGQARRWPQKAQQEYAELLAHADLRHVVRPWTESSIPGAMERDVTAAFMERDQWIVDQGHPILALWDGRRTGGTYATVQMAKMARRPIENEWDAFTAGAWLV